VVIDPCPRFALTVETTVGGPTGGQAMTGSMGALPCTEPLTLPTGAEHDFDLPSVDVSEAPKAGTNIEVRFAIAGIPATAAVIPVR
jgi:hypothetical protein